MLWWQDIHLFHKNTQIAWILNSLRQTYAAAKLKGHLDLVVIGGDLIDREVSYASKEIHLFHRWVAEFLEDLKANGTELFILEGTPLHDWEQPQVVTELNDAFKVGAKVNYVTHLCIQQHPKFGDILFIPDQWRPSCEETWEDVKKELIVHGLTQVDWIFMHGAFQHQMPPHLHKRIDLHISERYHKITKRFVFVGHHHELSQWENICCAGSLDRLTHGQEEAKGCFLVEVFPDKTNITFIENLRAKKYITLDCAGLDSSQLMSILGKYLVNEEHVAIRLKSEKTDVAAQSIDMLSDRYPFIDWSFFDVNQKEKTQIITINRDAIAVPKVNLNKENITKMLLKRLNLFPDRLEALQLKIDEVLRDV